MFMFTPFLVGYIYNITGWCEKSRTLNVRFIKNFSEDADRQNKCPLFIEKIYPYLPLVYAYHRTHEGGGMADVY